jgi:hypothetical protein
MKNLLYLIIMTFCIVVIGCNKVEQAKTDVEIEDKFQVKYPEGFEDFEGNICFIKYKNKIEGHSVKVVLHYFSFDSESKLLRGFAEILFYKNDSTPDLYFRAPNFCTETPYDTVKKGDVVELEYKLPKVDYSKPFKLRAFEMTPFFFLDVNFDGKKDLVLSRYGAAQRRMTAFVAYDVTDEIFDEFGYDYLYDELRDVPPYADMDCLTEIDYKKKEISTFDYEGNDISVKDVYRLVNGKIKLVRYEDYDSMGYRLARRRELKVDTITTYHNGREHIFK